MAFDQRADNHKMLVRVANREETMIRLIWVYTLCLCILGRNLVFRILEHLLYLKFILNYYTLECNFNVVTAHARQFK